MQQAEDNLTRPQDIYSIQAKIEVLFSAMADVRLLLRSIDETVSVVKVFDLKITRQEQDTARLESTLSEYRKLMDELEEVLEAQIEEARRHIYAKIKTLEEAEEKTRTTLSNKISYIRGAFATIAILGTVLYGLTAWIGSRYIDKIDSNDQYIGTLKTLDAEQHLKDSLQGKKVHFNETDKQGDLTK